MVIYSVGPIELGDDEVAELSGPDYEWLVYAYDVDGYEGDGWAVAYRPSDGKLVDCGLGHCSCYGPTDGGYGPQAGQTPDEFFAASNSIFDDAYAYPVLAKVAELLGVEPPRPPSNSDAGRPNDGAAAMPRS